MDDYDDRYRSDRGTRTRYRYSMALGDRDKVSDEYRDVRVKNQKPRLERVLFIFIYIVVVCPGFIYLFIFPQTIVVHNQTFQFVSFKTILFSPSKHLGEYF